MGGRERAGILVSALAPEGGNWAPRARAALSCQRDGDVLISIEARDTVSLRAAVNTYLRGCSMVMDSLSIVEGGV